MIPTFILTFDAGKNGQTVEWVRENPVGCTEQDIIDEIILGDCPLPFRNIYRVALGEVTQDVTQTVAEQVWKYAMEKPISGEAKRWLDWVGFDIPNAAE